MIKVNLETAKEIHKNNLRIFRSEEFKNLDIEFMRAVESNDSKKISEISKKKKELRDLTSDTKIETANNVDDLKNHWPDILNCKNPYKN
jgi:hypothetical protein